MSLKESFDGGRRAKVVAGVPLTTTPIPSSSGGVQQTGGTIDRLAMDRRYYSCKSVVRGRFLASTINNVSFAIGMQHSSDGTSWDNYSTQSNAAGTLGSTGATGAQTVEGAAEAHFSLVGARRYIRQVMTPTFASATSGDLFYAQGSIVLTGADELPNT
jgi:hypothetical protein